MEHEFCPSNRHVNDLSWRHEWLTGTVFRCDPGGELVLTMSHYLEDAGVIIPKRHIEVRTGPFTADLEVGRFFDIMRDEALYLL